MAEKHFDEVNLKIEGAVVSVSKDFDRGQVVVSIEEVPGEFVQVSLGEGDKRVVMINLRLDPDTARKFGSSVLRNAREL